MTFAMAALGVLVIAIGWLGWMLAAQDQDLERQRTTDRLEYAADLAVAELQRHLTATMDELAAIRSAADFSSAASRLSVQNDDAVIVVLDGPTLRSSVELPFYPDEPDRSDLHSSVFIESERIEITGRDLETAFRTYAHLNQSNDPSVRAGALLRLGRVARRLNRSAAALDAYEQLAKLGATPSAGRPSNLVALFERCSVLEELGRAAELQIEARALGDALVSGRWRLSRGEFHAYIERVTKWGYVAIAPPSTHIGELADGLQRAWDAGLRQRTGTPIAWNAAGHESLPTLAVWRHERDRTVGFIASHVYAKRVWFSSIEELASRQRARVSLTDDGGKVWYGDVARTGQLVNRQRSQTGLPFLLTTATSDPGGDSAGLVRRRRLWIAMFAILGLVLVSGGYMVARGIGRELEVARLQSDFVAAVSHEFRTPVAAVRQLSEVLDEGRVADEQRRSKYYGLLRRESERLQRLVEGLLDFRRMEANAAEYRFEKLDPAVMIREVAEEFRGSTADDSRLETRIEPNLPALRADREALGRALWNLLDNAVKYSPPGSAVSLEAGATDGRIVIRVRDQGPGIAPSEQRRVFDKFVRGESARSTGAKGTGLGLAMVSHIMRAHRGEVTIESEPGAGATFSLVLPAEGPGA